MNCGQGKGMRKQTSSAHATQVALGVFKTVASDEEESPSVDKKEK